MRVPKRGLSLCPCCRQQTLQHNGAFLTCATCGLAITTQALLRAERYTQETTLMEGSVARSYH